GEQKAVGQPPAIARLLAVLLVVVNGVVVAGHAGEEHEVRVGEGPRRALEPIADLEILEVPLHRHQALQKISRASAESRAPKISTRRLAAPGKPLAYHARCFFSWIAAVRGGRSASISESWRRMMRTRSSRSVSAPRKIHGAPSAPRPTMTAA